MTWQKNGEFRPSKSSQGICVEQQHCTSYQPRKQERIVSENRFSLKKTPVFHPNQEEERLLVELRSLGFNSHTSPGQEFPVLSQDGAPGQSTMGATLGKTFLHQQIQAVASSSPQLGGLHLFHRIQESWKFWGWKDLKSHPGTSPTTPGCSKPMSNLALRSAHPKAFFGSVHGNESQNNGKGEKQLQGDQCCQQQQFLPAPAPLAMSGQQRL